VDERLAADGSVSIRETAGARSIVDDNPCSAMAYAEDVVRVVRRVMFFEI
jgi:hypothetical protein